MSEKMTRISLPNQRIWCGLMDWGELTAEQMIKQARQVAEHLRNQAEEIDKACDSEFQIDLVRGPVVQRHIREIQGSKRHETQTSKSEVA